MNTKQPLERSHNACLLLPLRDKKISVAGAAVVPVAAEGKELAIIRKHREGIEGVVRGDALQARTVDIDHVQVEGEAALGLKVGAEDDFLPAGVEERAPVGLTQIGHLSHIGAVGICHIDFHVGRLHQTLSEEAFVLGYFRRSLGSAGPPHDLRAIGGEKCTAVVAQFKGDLTQVAAVDVHGVELEVTGAIGGEDDFITLGGDGGLGVVAIAVSELGDDVALEVGHEYVKGIVDGPHIFTAGLTFRLRRTGGVVVVGGGEKHGFIAREEVGASGAAPTGADQSGYCIRPHLVGPGDVDLIAF